MKNLKSIFKSSLLFTLVFVVNQVGFSQLTGITIDEDFTDWNQSMETFTDGADNPNGLDLLDFQVTNDQHNLYIKFTLSTEIALADDLVPHGIWLCIDADNDPTTGYVQQAEYGTELAINFNQHYAWFNQPSGNVRVGFEAIKLRQAPTVTSNTFEIAIPRNIMPDSVSPLFTHDTIRILIRDDEAGDAMPNVGDIFQYTFSSDTVAAITPIPLEKEDPTFIRAVSYNVLFNNGWELPGITHMEQIVKALQADIYCFQEADDISPQEVKSYMDNWVPTGTQEGWHVSIDYSKITCTRWPQTNDWVLERAHAMMVDLPESYGRDLLLLNGHLSCCTQNQNRQNQADDFAAFILDAKVAGGRIEVPKNTPIMFMGDMNLVGFNQQRKTILSGDIQDVNTYGLGGLLDWDSTELADAAPLHINQNMAYTWRSFSGTTFPNGRLDYQFYSDAILQKEKAFVLQTEVLPSDYLANYNLDSANTWGISDHLPVVVDYSILDEPVGIEQGNHINLKPTIYPNPAGDVVFVDVEGDIDHIQLQDLTGSVILNSIAGEKALSLKNIPAGVYVLNISVGGKSYHSTIVHE